ncbi:MAG: DUF4011 domain-containing protein [Jiangellaceae bacterium]
MTAVDDPTSPAAGSARLTRAELVTEAAAGWTAELAALGGRDPLLQFRDLKVGTLDLAAAEPEARKKLLDGEAVAITRLFPHEPLRSSALRSVHAIRDKARELADEHGLSACVLAVGIATWADPFAAHRPTAPVLLRPATVTARDPAETDFLIRMAEEPEVNPVLLQALDAQVGLRFEPDDLRDPAGALRYPVVVERMREFAPAHVVDGFSIAHRAVLGTFAKEPLTLARDLAAFGPELEAHDVVAALAGDPVDLGAAPASRPGPLPDPVLDADTAQRAVVAAAVAGGHLRVDAPPGTGRTQTTANVVAELTARGQQVLVVGQKQSILVDLVARLRSVGLDDLVLDLSHGRTSTAAAVQHVADTARRVAAEPREAPPLDRRGAAEPLEAYVEALHRPRQPWGTSAYDAMVALVAAPKRARSPARISADALRRMDPETISALSDRLRQYTDFEGLSPAQEDSPWHGATVSTVQEADVLAATVMRLWEKDLPALRDAATRAAVEAGLVAPQTPAECFETVDLLKGVAATRAQFAPEVWDAPLDDLVAATADRRRRTDHGRQLGLFGRRRLRRQARDLVVDTATKPDRSHLHVLLVSARDQLAAWRVRARDARPPQVGAHLPAATRAVDVVRAAFNVLGAANPRTSDLPGLPYAKVAQRLTALAAAEARLAAIPRLTGLEAELSAAGLDDLLAVLRERGADATTVVAAFDHVRNASLLDAWLAEDPVLRDFDTEEHERRIDVFRQADAEAQREAAARVRAARAARFQEVAEEHEGQAVVVESAAPRTPRELLVAAPDVALAAVPCWVMSPLTVAGALPARRLFDVVVVEDAGRLAVAQAVPAIARGSRVVLVGDDRQVVGTAFSTVAEPDVDPDDGSSPLTEPPPSILDALRGLPSVSLTTHYRARDDRLVALPGRTEYRGRLTAVPGVRGPSRLRHELVETTAEGDEPVDSAVAEVSRVVELILEHGRTRPYESLGVVTLGSRHARRIDDALRHALVRAPDVAAFLRDDREEPFYVKDAERAAGDVRDAVLLSIGYGRSVDGRVLYRFGVLDRPGGERRLIAAASSARERITVVSCFAADDLSPRRLTTPGGQALRDFLAFVAASGSLAIGDAAADPLEAVVAERLRAAGIDVVVGHGNGPGRIAVAARHPARSDRLVLAVETDGPAYATQATVQVRDRLRPEHLARLGWTVHRVWSPAWAADPEGAAERLLAAYDAAVTAADAYDWAEAAADADGLVGLPDDGEHPEDGGPAGVVGIPDDADLPADRGSRPSVARGRPIGTYTRRELAALARWVDADGEHRSEVAAVAAVADELGLAERGRRADDALRHAVRVARAGAPPL